MGKETTNTMQINEIMEVFVEWKAKKKIYPG
jgi:hypothetical protein